MFHYLRDKFDQWLGLHKSTGPFIGSDTTIAAFGDPSSVPSIAALTIIDSVVANRPDADQLREALAIRFIKEHGITMHGATIHDDITGIKGDPDLNPDTLFISPYARPTAGATVMPAYTNDKGEIFIAIVKNWKDPKDHNKGIEDDWRFPGGYMDARDAKTRRPQAYDHNLDATAIRELHEEINIELGPQSKPQQLFVRSDCGAEQNLPNHPINAFYLADLGRFATAPAIKAGDDVAVARWINVRDIERHTGSAPSETIYHCTVDGAHDSFRYAHAELLERGIQELRGKLFPLQNDTQFLSQLDKSTHAHYDRVAQAHGFEASPQQQAQPAWQERLQTVEAPSSGQTIH